MVKNLVIEKEFVLDGTLTYLMYDNADQDILLTMCYDEKDIKEESKFYFSGVWFVCDNTVDTNIILNERKYKKKVKFPSEPEKRFQYGGIDEKYEFSSKMGDLR